MRAAAETLTSALARDIAAALRAPVALVPHLPELLEDLTDLSGLARHVVHAVKSLGLPPATRVLDLACGKGAAAVRLAEQFDFDVVGVDAMPAFVEEARQRAGDLGIGERCRFRCGDLRDTVDEEPFDVAQMIGLRSPVADRVRILRRAVRPGGHLLIDALFLEEPRPIGTRADAPTRGELRRALVAHGDVIIGELIPTQAEVGRVRQLNTRSIRRRAELLGRRLPRLSGALRRYVDVLEESVCVQAAGVTSGVWVLRRAAS